VAIVATVALLLAAPTQNVVLLDFTAAYCGPCQQMKPTVHRLAADGYPVKEVDIQKNQALAARLQVTSIPTFMVLVDDRVVAKAVGPRSYGELVGMLERAGYSKNAAPPTSTDNITAAPSSLGGRSPHALPHRASQEKQESATPGNKAERRALYSTVRIKIEDATGYSYGTGTVVDMHGKEALVLTCGHLFRDYKKGSRITVELFHPESGGPIPGRLISWEAPDRNGRGAAKHDIGFVSFRPDVQVEAAPVGGVAKKPQRGDRIFTIGCNEGADATIRRSYVTHINRYGGPDNIEAAGEPVEGRSGGGLFDDQGVLIGVCNAADPTDHEGVYAALASVHVHLDRIGQQRIYAPQTELVQTTPERSPQSSSRASGVGSQRSGPRGQLGLDPLTYFSERDARTRANNVSTTPAGANDEVEVIVVIRSKANPSQSRTVVLPNPPQVLLQQIEQEHRLQTPSRGSLHAANHPEGPARVPNREPIVRGQSE